MKVAVVDYQAGNLKSVMKGLSAANARPFLTADPAQIACADGVVIPGVGHFGATTAIGAAMRDAIHAAVDRGTPLLGICLGLQFLFDGSEEAPDVPGLGLLPGRCARLQGDIKVPHVGWNTLEHRRDSRLLETSSDAYVYFTHSYAAPVTEACVRSTTYGSTFASVVERGIVYGVQFHPEKSATYGIDILRSFVALCLSPNV